ncbi:MAG: glutaredoxin 3 [Gammaproteobacteria bacterium]|nr:glutaredoxin 3 [Gammaproteobacteria bacterium]
MPSVVVYCTTHCPYCTRAKALLDKKGVEYNEINLDVQPDKRAEMESLSGRTSVPQIFIDDFHVGGFDDMVDLDMDDELDPKLGIA